MAKGVGAEDDGTHGPRAEKQRPQQHAQRPNAPSPQHFPATTHHAPSLHSAQPTQPRARTGTTTGSQPTPSDGPIGYVGPSPAPIDAPTWKRRLYIDRSADLLALAKELQRAHVIALDAEFSQRYTHAPGELSHRLALLQIAIDDDYGVSYVVDTQRLGDLSPLREPLANPASLKLFHGIGADARVLATRNLVARHTLDLEAVSRSIFGQRESGLQAMLQRACGVRLDKSLQRADWSRRPLTPAMVAYAARDAEMTLVLYRWLSANYPWAIELFHVQADEPPLAVAPWILPYLDGPRPRPALLAVAEAGIADDLPAQEQATRAALAAAFHPNHRARILRLITDLELTGLAADVRAYLSAPAAEERASAVRAVGRLRDAAAIPALQKLLDDPVHDVRQSAQYALETISLPRRPPRPVFDRTASAAENADSAATPTSAHPSATPTRGRRVRWTSGSDHDSPGESDDGADWRAALRATLSTPSETPTDE